MNPKHKTQPLAGHFAGTIPVRISSSTGESITFGISANGRVIERHGHDIHEWIRKTDRYPAEPLKSFQAITLSGPVLAFVSHFAWWSLIDIAQAIGRRWKEANRD